MAAFKIPEAEFVLSCPRVELAPKRPLPEIAFAGRSNVGKSSLINSLLNRKQIAMTSKAPGKTRLLNYFLIGRGWCYFVDLPGYGYAKVSQSLKDDWGEYLEAYFRDAPRLILSVLLIDVRRGVTPLDEQMVDGLAIYKRPFLAILTKADKLNAAELARTVRRIGEQLMPRGARRIIPYSAINHMGRDLLWAEVRNVIEEQKARP
ncbi:YihA family ribosome biogenesis GTP-binding protein [candidate division KSB1 bacterium]|nr:YihA family ribosome biogenesis GTP-binding protein [candidate division KSB1 bacterium]